MNESTFRSLFHEAIGEIQVPAQLSSQARLALKHAGHKGPDIGLELGAAQGQRLARNRFADRHTPMGRRTELTAGIAAVLLAATVIGTFAFIRAATRPHTVAPPITSASPSPPPLRPSPSPLSQPLQVDPATPVILFLDPTTTYGLTRTAHQLDGLTWDGQRAGKITQIPACTPECQRIPPNHVIEVGSFNPAGTLIAMWPYIFDRSGRVLVTLRGGPYSQPGVGDVFLGTWADDELHYCRVVPAFGAGRGTLQLTTPVGTPHDVAQVGTVSSSKTFGWVFACSVLADRAVVTEVAFDGNNLVNQYWVVQLSTGRILWTHNLRGTNTNVVASRDGRYVAELESNGSTNIYGPSGSLVGHLTATVQSFSWDGSLAVVYTPGGAACRCEYGPQASVIRWSSGTVIWTAPASQVLYASQPEPAGGSMAIQTGPGPGTDATGHPQIHLTRVLYVISSDGQVVDQRVVGGGYG